MDTTIAERYLVRMRACAAALGREFREPSAATRDRRLDARDVELFERGVEAGLVSIVKGYRLVTRDPWQGTAWLVEGNPAWPCWEYLPHTAAYVELILDYGYPAPAIGFETDDSEMNLDLLAVSERGAALVLGEAKAESRQVNALAQDLPQFAADPGKPPPKSVPGAPKGAFREAWKLAHQLWTSRPPFLWLVASGSRLAFAVDYRSGLTLTSIEGPPTASELWPSGFGLDARPRLQPQV